MPTHVEKVLGKFCKLTSKKKERECSDYERQLEMAYAEDLNQNPEECRVISLPSGSGGLQKAGGRLLGEFIQRHPEIEELHLAGNMLNDADGEEVTNSEGVDALLSGLAQTRAQSCLRVLDLSDGVYTPEQMGVLAADVISHHPTLTTLKLDAAFFSDAHLEAMLPFWTNSHLRTFSLRQNADSLKGTVVFAQWVEVLLTQCPDLQLIDLAGNRKIKAGGPAAQALLRLVTEKSTVFVRLPQDEAVQNQSLKNHYTVAMPMAWFSVDNSLQQFMEKAGITVETLQALPALMMEVRANRDGLAHAEAKRVEDQAAIQQRLQEMYQYTQTLSGRVAEMNAKCLQKMEENRTVQLIQEEMMTKISERMDISALSLGAASVSMTPDAMVQQFNAFRQEMLTKVSDLSERVETVEDENGASRKTIAQLKQTLNSHSDLLEQLDEKTDDIQAKVAELKTDMDKIIDDIQQMDARWKGQWEALSPLLEDHALESTLTPEQNSYVKKFKQSLVQMYMVASSASSGSFQLTHTGTAGTVATMLTIGASFVPWAGGALQMLASFLQVVDAELTKRRMERIVKLGNTPEEVARLSVTLSRRLIPCLSLDNECQDSTLTKLMSASTDILSAFSSDGFYGALFASLQASGAVDVVLEHIGKPVTVSTMEARAQSDVKLLIAAISEGDVPRKDAALDMDRLFLFAAPVLTLVDYVFIVILKQFCEQERCLSKDLSISSHQRGKFYSTLATGFHAHADTVSQRLESTEAQTVFIQGLATGFSSKSYADHTIGVLYFTSTGTTFFGLGSKRPVGIREKALDAETTKTVLDTALTIR